MGGPGPPPASRARTLEAHDLALTPGSVAYQLWLCDLGRCLHLSDLQLPHPYSGDSANTPDRAEWLGALNDFMRVRRPPGTVTGM